MKNIRFEIRSESENADPALAAVTELRSAAAAYEARLAEQVTALQARFAELETRAARAFPAQQSNPEQAEIERRAVAMRSYLRYGAAAPAEELRALTVNSDPSGGYLVTPEMSTEFIRNLVEFSPIRSVASVRTTGSPSVMYPKRTNVTNAAWKGETLAQSESTVGFGQAEIQVKELNTYVDISNQLLADSAGAAESEVNLALAEDFAKKEATAFVNGNGVLEPEGFMTNADIAYTANGHATTLAADPLITLMYALPATYRANGVWAMNGNTLATIRKLKDGQGNYLWQPSYQAGQPETILGRPVVEMLDMPDIASGAFPIIYGDFSAYRIVDRIGMSVMVNPYILATNGITRIHATRRTGGGILQAARFRKLKMATS